MSIVPKESIEVIAQSLGINNLSPDVLPNLASDVEYRVREIMQEAIKCMRHSRRTTLSTDDVDSALSMRNVEPLYGFASGDPRRFKRALGHKDLFYVDEKDVELKDVLDAPFPKAPLDTAVVTHWLAIEGVQPCIPENAPLQALATPSDNRTSEYKEDGVPVELKLPVKHVLSLELQFYFEKITDLTTSKSSSALFKEAMMSLATDSGLHPLVPYFTYFIADEVSRNLNNFHLLFSLMRLVWSLLQNPHIHVELYLHQLMPSVMTCLVSRRLGNKLFDNHWELRSFTANLAALICKRYGHAYHSLQPRVTRTLLHTFLDPTKSLNQHYGAIQGLAALGSSVVHLLVLPNIGPYLNLIEPEMQLEMQKNEMKRLEAWRVHGALRRAVGIFVYERLKLIPSILSPPAISPWTKNRKVLTTSSNKRKGSMENSQQPPLKKLSTEGSMGIEVSAGTSVGYNTANRVIGESGFVSSLSNDNNSIGRRDLVVANKVRKTSSSSSSVLRQAWKEDAELAKYLPSDYFGESMHYFVPSPELLSFFL